MKQEKVPTFKDFYETYDANIIDKFEEYLNKIFRKFFVLFNPAAVYTHRLNSAPDEQGRRSVKPMTEEETANIQDDSEAADPKAKDGSPVGGEKSRRTTPEERAALGLGSSATEYECQRARNMARNKQLMKDLEIEGTLQEMGEYEASLVPKGKPKKRKGMKGVKRKAENATQSKSKRKRNAKQ